MRLSEQSGYTGIMGLKRTSTLQWLRHCGFDGNDVKVDASKGEMQLCCNDEQEFRAKMRRH